MSTYKFSFWEKTPFLKLLLAFIAGILLQFHFELNIGTWLTILVFAFLSLLIFFLLPFFSRFKFRFIAGICVALLFISLGALFVWQKNIRNNRQWFGNYYTPTKALLVKLIEPSVEKTKSIKVNAEVDFLLQDQKAIPTKGKIILYFKKDSTLPKLEYGMQIVLKKTLQEIKNSGNPGGFDYKRYALFQGITHQVFLKPGEFEIIDSKKANWLYSFMYRSQERILSILRRNISGEKELGLAEALLIGYKDDLDQSLVQSYTNTGVVHIIAISGLHLGLIYWLLALLLKPLQKSKKLKWLRPILIILGLWLFSLLTGAQPSILRSAIMFTCIVLGESLSRKTSIYNTMAFSAFILLCINPFWLWDVGFQLSYAAVLSIIIFMQPIYNWFYFKNKLLDNIWKLNAVTIAAQILTVPLSIYHFHQFPNLFLLTNFLAVPLSSAILLGEIFLCVISLIPPLAYWTGKLIGWLIWLMNTYIERIETISFSLWDGLQISLLQTILLFIFTIAVSYWLMEKSTAGLKFGLFALLGFAALRSYSFMQSDRQQKLIVYNVPQKKAIDIINGRNHYFIGDSDLRVDGFARNFHLKPARTLYRVNEAERISNLFVSENYFNYKGKHILLLDKTVSLEWQFNKPVIDVLILSGNPKIYMTKIAAVLQIKQVVFDGSVPTWKTHYWKKDCDSLHIPWHETSTNGAFEMKLE